MGDRRHNQTHPASDLALGAQIFYLWWPSTLSFLVSVEDNNEKRQPERE